MKGKISISDFIHGVKKELVEAQTDSGTPFYELEEVTLEISFALEVTGKAKMNFYVVDVGGETKATQTHKVQLKLIPLEQPLKDKASQGRSSGGAPRKTSRTKRPAYKKRVM